jgi:hypothetical protein
MKQQNISKLQELYNKTYGNSKTIQDALKEYMFTYYYFDDYLNGSILSYLFNTTSDDIDTQYDFILRMFDIRRWSEFKEEEKNGLLHIHNAWKEHFSWRGDRKVIHVMFNLCNDTGVVKSETTYNLFISYRKFKKYFKKYLKQIKK